MRSPMESSRTTKSPTAGKTSKASSTSSVTRPTGPSPEFNLSGNYETNGSGSVTVTPQSSGAGKTTDFTRWNGLNAASALAPSSMSWDEYSLSYVEQDGSNGTINFNSFEQDAFEMAKQARQEAEASSPSTMNSGIPTTMTATTFEEQGYTVRRLNGDLLELTRSLVPPAANRPGEMRWP